MTIVKSIIESVDPQANGLRYVTELHVDDTGVEHRIVNLRDKTVDDDIELARHAEQLPIDLARQE